MDLIIRIEYKNQSLSSIVELLDETLDSYSLADVTVVITSKQQKPKQEPKNV